ncbi:hypothetical protein TSUD_142630 [Trifolium subterraneum]|uniref:Uncharacterized protein n=1 Tax=Trifolium subterraneum TaxID=3900 RepID=A0A2Z6MBB6_TRISU|nr:hypothetical protein TSUD_142630 [Trifolium subterraneum]
MMIGTSSFGIPPTYYSSLNPKIGMLALLEDEGLSSNDGGCCLIKAFARFSSFIEIFVFRGQPPCPYGRIHQQLMQQMSVSPKTLGPCIMRFCLRTDLWGDEDDPSFCCGRGGYFLFFLLLGESYFCYHYQSHV